MIKKLDFSISRKDFIFKTVKLGEEKILGLYDAEKQEKMVKDAQIEYATKLGKEEVAKNLLKKGISMDIIISSTGLNQKEILKLK